LDESTIVDEDSILV